MFRIQKKDEVKGLGAKWDSNKKKRYVNERKDLGYYKRQYNKREKYNEESLDFKSTLVVSSICFTDDCEIPLLRLSDAYRLFEENEISEKKLLIYIIH